MFSTPEAYQIIDSNEDFIIVNKLVEADFHDCEGKQGLFSQIKSDLKLESLYPVHRLDKVTTGLLIFAKTLTAAQFFQHQFEERHIEKIYLALSDKKPKKKQGLIIGDMEKARRGMWKLMRTKTNPAITQFFSVGTNEGIRLFILKPHTGKTHQLRVALASIGAPIMGDPLYSQALPNTYLHAYSLKFNFQNKSYNYKARPHHLLWGSPSIANTINADADAPFDLPWPTLPHNQGKTELKKNAS